MKRVKTVTSRDVARAAGVSQAAVSYVINNSANARISRETRERILKAARELGYYPNAIARSMRTNVMKTIGVVSSVPGFRYSTYETISGIYEALRAKDFTLLLCGPEMNTDREFEYIRFFLENRVAGIIFISSTYRTDYKHLLSLKERNVPHVVINGYPNDQEIDTVNIDDFGGAMAAVRHLLKQGRRKIIFVGGPVVSRAIFERMNGYKGALEEAGIEPDPALILVSGKVHNLNEGYNLTKGYLEGGGKVDGVYAVNDEMAIGAMKALEEYGIKPGVDVSIVGTGDSREGLVVSPRLSSVALPLAGCGKVSAEILMQRLSKEGIPTPQHRILPCQLIIRESSGERLG